MKKRILLSCILGGLVTLGSLWSPHPVQAICQTYSSPPTFAAGEYPNDPCDLNGNRFTTTNSAAVRQSPIANTITSNAISAAATVPSGSNTLFGRVDGTGMVSVTLSIYGGFESSASLTGKVLVCVVNLIGPATVVDLCRDPFLGTPYNPTINYPFYVVQSTNLTGTNASAQVLAAY